MTTNVTQTFKPPPPSSRAAVHTAIAASTRWKLMLVEGREVVLKRVIDLLVYELVNVERGGWRVHIRERLGKVAGGECKRAKMWLDVPGA